MAPAPIRKPDSLEFESFFRLSKRFGDLSGVVHLDSKPAGLKTRMKNIYFWISYVHNVVAFFQEMIYYKQAVDRNAGFVHLMALIPLMAHCLLAITKLTVYKREERELRAIFTRLKQMHPSSMDATLVGGYSRRIRYTNIFVIFYMGTLLAFNFVPFVPLLCEYFKTGVFNKRLPFFLWYWFDWKQPVVYGFVFLDQMWGSSAVVSANLLTDLLLCAFVMLIGIQFDLLNERLVQVQQSDDQEMRQCIDLHINLLELCDGLERIYSPALLASFVLSSLIICLTGFQTVEGESLEEMVRYSTFLFVHMVHSYLLCFFGNMVMEKSAAVSHHIYQSPWYSAKSASQKASLMILMRGQKVQKLTAMKFANVSLECFTSILSTAFSYFTLLLAVQDLKKPKEIYKR